MKAMRRIRRRQFLGALGPVGYSVVAFVEGGVEAGAGAAPSSREAIVGRLDALIPAAGTPGAERNMAVVELECDLLVAGGGPAGVCAALAAARNGARVVLVQDRSRLGGNSSSEVRMHIVGADMHGSRAGWREGGLLEELRLDDAAENPHRCWELWDLLLYDKLVSEPGITLLLDTTVYAAETRDGRIAHALARCDKSERIYRVRAPLYADCTGDCRLALEAGAALMRGRDGRAAFGEPLAPPEPTPETQGSSILFTARRHETPIAFRPPRWARPIGREQLQFRPVSSWEYGYWWIEWGGHRDTIADNERIRFELLSIVMGIWDYIKNSGEFPGAANWSMDWVGMVPGKRESRRIIGEHVLTEHDLRGAGDAFKDAVAIGGWGLDEHPPRGFDASDEKPFVSIRLPEVYSIPLRSLYSRDVANLLMAGRNISASHVAFTSTRVMGTCAVTGQAAGTAAALCARLGLLPRELVAEGARLAELQQLLLRDDQTIKGLRNEDPADLARGAAARASAIHADAAPEHALDGFVRDEPERWAHRWAAPMTEEGPWLELAWPQPREIRLVQITFDSGFHRELTLSAQESANRRVVRGPQPETVRDYRLLGRAAGSAEWTELASVTGNHQRLCRHEFAPVALEALRLHVTATHGAAEARVYEVRCYG